MLLLLHTKLLDIFIKVPWPLCLSAPWNHRTIEWFWLGGTFKGHHVQHPVMSRDILNQTELIRAPKWCPVLMHLQIYILIWSVSYGHREGKKVWSPAAAETAISVFPFLSCASKTERHPAERDRSQFWVPGKPSGLCGPFKYKQYAGFSASHIAHGKLSGNLSLEQNTVLNEAWSSIIGHPGETFKWWLTIKNK